MGVKLAAGQELLLLFLLLLRHLLLISRSGGSSVCLRGRGRVGARRSWTRSSLGLKYQLVSRLCFGCCQKAALHLKHAREAELFCHAREAKADRLVRLPAVQHVSAWFAPFTRQLSSHARLLGGALFCFEKTNKPGPGVLICVFPLSSFPSSTTSTPRGPQEGDDDTKLVPRNDGVHARVAL